MKQTKTIRIYHENKMLISDWCMFIVGLGFMYIFLVNMVNVINTIETGSSKLLALLILLFAFTKIVSFVKVPTHFTASDLIEDIEVRK